EITPRTMYLAHVLGARGAVDLMKRTGSTGAPPEVPSPDAATGDQMRAWVRALRLGAPRPAGAPRRFAAPHSFAPLAGCTTRAGTPSSFAAPNVSTPMQFGTTGAVAPNSPDEDAGARAYAPVQPII